MPASAASSAPALILRPSPFHGRWLWATIAVALGTLLLCRLGVWQLQRLQQREAANAALLARLSQPPLQLTGPALDPAAADMRKGTAEGTYDFGQEITLRDQELNSAPGVHLITPLRIAGSSAAVLVDRGWVPADASAPEQRGAFDQPAGQVEVHGIIHQTETRLNFLSPDDPAPAGPSTRADAWFRVNIERIQKQVPYPLLPVFLEEGDPNLNSNDAAITPGEGHLPATDIEIDLSNGPHLGYAIQWFCFAAILVAGYTALVRRKGDKRHPDPEGAPRGDGDPAEPAESLYGSNAEGGPDAWL
jgi:surfeit locus 1 family protein